MLKVKKIFKILLVSQSFNGKDLTLIFKLIPLLNVKSLGD